MALYNLGLNPLFSSKVISHNFGLAGKESQLVIPYSLSQKGRMGLSGLPKKSNKIKEVSEQQINLKPVNDQF